MNRTTPSTYLRSTSATERYAKQRCIASEELDNSEHAACIKQLLSNFGKEHVEDGILNVQVTNDSLQGQSPCLWRQILVLFLQMVIIVCYARPLNPNAFRRLPCCYFCLRMPIHLVLLVMIRLWTNFPCPSC